jgi:hypothetical protein
VRVWQETTNRLRDPREAIREVGEVAELDWTEATIGGQAIVLRGGQLAQ